MFNEDVFDKTTLSDDVLITLKNIRIKNIGKIIIATLNVNSLSQHIDTLKVIIPGNIDILVLTETKLDDSFPTSQFLIDGFSEPYRLDRNHMGGGVAIYTREDIPSKLLTKHSFPNDTYRKDNYKGPIEGMFVEINLRKTKWLLLGTYHRPRQNNQYYFDNITKALDLYLTTYDKFLLVGDFNTQEGDTDLDNFLDMYKAGNLVKEKNLH